jgi:hypothetical protein
MSSGNSIAVPVTRDGALGLSMGFLAQARAELAQIATVEAAVAAADWFASAAEVAKRMKLATPILNEANLLRAEASMLTARLVAEAQARGDVKTDGRPAKLSEARTVSEIVPRQRLAEGRKLLAHPEALERARQHAAEKPDEPMHFARILKLTTTQKNAERRDAERKAARARAAKTKRRADVYHCSCRALIERVQAGSVDVILTDPPYPKKFLDCYCELAEFAAHALKPGGLLVTMFGSMFLPDVVARLGAKLEFWWQIAYETPGAKAYQPERDVNPCWKPLLVYVRPGKRPALKIGGDLVRSDNYQGARGEQGHKQKWEQSESGVTQLVEKFSLPGQFSLRSVRRLRHLPRDRAPPRPRRDRLRHQDRKRPEDTRTARPGLEHASCK